MEQGGLPLYSEPSGIGGWRFSSPLCAYRRKRPAQPSMLGSMKPCCARPIVPLRPRHGRRESISQMREADRALCSPSNRSSSLP